MKNLTLIVGTVSMFAMIACGDNNHERNNSTVAPAETKQIEPVKPAPQKESDGTTIKMDDNGVSVKSTSGENKNDIIISSDSSKVEIKRKK